jgi:hypothetical protein
MNSERDIDAIATWENRSGYIGRSTGPRREEPAICYECGQPLEDDPVQIDGHQFCSRACLDVWIRR